MVVLPLRPLLLRHRLQVVKNSGRLALTASRKGFSNG
jgi:hypothetical protein